jgi:hypothetical protein
MSKTIELQIEKSHNLIQGLRKHLSTGVGGGITSTEIEKMESELATLTEANEVCDRLRAELSQKVKHMNGILADVKRSYVDKKKVIKVNFLQEEWMKYGVQDKR